MPIRNPEYLSWIRRQPCAADSSAYPCPNPSEASHHGPRGMGQKTDDYRTIPLCHDHHTQWHQHGTLFGWDRATTDAWIQERIIRLLIEWAERKDVF